MGQINNTQFQFQMYRLPSSMIITVYVIHPCCQLPKCNIAVHPGRTRTHLHAVEPFVHIIIVDVAMELPQWMNSVSHCRIDELPINKAYQYDMAPIRQHCTQSIQNIHHILVECSRRCHVRHRV